MNQKIATGVGTLIIIIIAVTMTVFVWLYEKDRPIDDGQVVRNHINKKTNIAFTRIIGGKSHVIYNGNDLGETANPYPVVSGDNIAFEREIDGKTHETHIIKNGQDMGVGAQPMMSGENLLFFRVGDSSRLPHIIFNGQDMGEIFVAQALEAELAGDNAAFERNIGEKTHIIYNGKDLGEGNNPKLSESGKSVAFIREITTAIKPLAGIPDPNLHVIYNGEDMGSGQYIFALSDEFVFFSNLGASDQDGIFNNIFKNKESLGQGNDVIISGNNYMYRKTIDGLEHIIFNGKDMGEMSDITSDMRISGNNFVFTRFTADKKATRIIYNGKDIDEGENPVIEGDNIAYDKEINGKKHIIYNGQDLGEGQYAALSESGENIAFIREVGGVKHAIFNGDDLGEIDKDNFSIQFAE